MSNPNPYAVERTSFRYGQTSTQQELPEELVITLVRLAGTEYFEMFVNGDQVGAVHRNADFVAEAVKFVTAKNA